MNNRISMIDFVGRINRIILLNPVYPAYLVIFSYIILSVMIK
jgi:hypothetical protein